MSTTARTSSVPAPQVQDPLLALRSLGVSYAVNRHRLRPALESVSLDVGRAQTVALVGESGSGKSTTAGAVIGLLAGNARVTSGSAVLAGPQGRGGTDLDLLAASEQELRAVRGARIGYVPQDPGTSLNPLKTVGANVAEALRIHRRSLRHSETRERVLALLDRVGLDRPGRRIDQYPHELSGGMRQRVLIAAAIALDPKLVVADEPTSALDVTVQQKILDLLDGLRTESGTSVLLITHDLAVAAERADRVVVMQHGQVVEQGSAQRVFADPQEVYTRRLLADAPSLQVLTNHSVSPRQQSRVSSEALPGVSEQPVVAVRNLTKVYARPKATDHDGSRGPGPTVSRGPTAGSTAGRDFDATPVIGIEGVSFSVPRGTTHGIVGESGSGKTTLGKMLAGVVPPDAGSGVVAGTDVADLGRRSSKASRQFRRVVQLVQQNPHTAIDPRSTTRQAIEEPLRNFRIGDAAGRERAVRAAMERVSLSHDLADSRPRELSGGQLQRVALARALILEPELVVLDEAVSALDVTVQAQILRLLEELQQDLGLTYVFISHDLAVVRQIADTVSVVSAGHQVEEGPTDQVFENPQHAYTRRLIEAIPRPPLIRRPDAPSTQSSCALPTHTTKGCSS